MKFFKSNEAIYRLLRTIVQGLLGVAIAELDVILGAFTIPPVWKPLIAAGIMAILSPIMAAMGGNQSEPAVKK